MRRKDRNNRLTSMGWERSAAGVWASEELSEHFFIFRRSHYEHLRISQIININSIQWKQHIELLQSETTSVHHARHISAAQTHLLICNISLHATASVFLFPSCPASCFYLCFNRNTQAALICMCRWSFATQLDTEAKVKLNSLMPFIDEWKQHMLLIHPQMMYINLRAAHNAAWPFCNYQGDRSDAYRSLTRVHSQHFDCNRHRLTVFNLELNHI